MSASGRNGNGPISCANGVDGGYHYLLVFTWF